MFRNERLHVLADIRQAAGTPIPAQASDMGIGAATLRSYISGYSTPSINVLCIMCDYYGVNPDWLLGYSNSSLHVELKVG